MANNDRKEVKLPPLHEIFSFSVRFNIMLILHVHMKIGFTRLQKLLNLTSGNLIHHLTKLSENGYVTTNKMLLSARPMSIIHITEKGKESFGLYLAQFKDILNDIEL